MTLEVSGLTVEYRMKRTGVRLRALEDLSFIVRPNQFVTIVGPSGCGKTTLLKVIARLILPSAGSVSFNGEVLDRPGDRQAMVFQSPSLLPWRTVFKNVTYGLELQGTDPNRMEQRATEAIHRVGLAGFENSFPNELSEGMRQRVNLARALATEPRLLLLDEPFAALDAQTRAYMQLELQKIWQGTSSTAIFVTHQISEAILLGDVVIVLTARPGQVKGVLPVEIERPRRLDMKRSSVFNLLEEKIWGLIGEEAEAMRNKPIESAGETPGPS